MAELPNDSSRLISITNDAECSIIQSNDSGSSEPSINNNSQDADSDLWNEMDKQWPATFERSISLLSSPLIMADKANDLTRSPKPGNTPVAIRRRKIRSDSVGTPGPIGLIPPSSRLSFRDYGGDEHSSVMEDGNMDFNTTKAHLISQQAKLIPLEKTRKELDLKKHDAAEYRKKILAQQCKEGKVSNASLNGNKTTFSQCVFNMANILMGVGLLGLPYAFAKAGFLGGIFAILTFAILCRTSSILIGRELRMKKTIRSFPDIAREAFGDTGAIILGIVLYFELFACVAIFIVSIGDHLHELFPLVSVQTHMVCFTIISALPVIGKT